jgi:ankyrin repeat protein
LIENSEGLSPLMIASMNGYNDIVAYLALRSHDLNQEDKNGETVLVHYLYKSDLKMA